MIRILNHRADVDDLCRELKDMLPVRIQFERGRSIDGTEHEQILALNRFFHGGIVKTISEKTGMTVKEAKEWIQKNFCLISDTDPSAFKLKSLVRHNLFTSEETIKKFSKRSGINPSDSERILQIMLFILTETDGISEVESTSGMSLERLRSLVLQCNVFISDTFGESVEPPMLGNTKVL